METLLTIIHNPEDSKELVKFALSLAADLQTNLQLLFVQDPVNYTYGTPGLTGSALVVKIKADQEKLAENTKKLLWRFVKECTLGDISVKISTETGIIKFIIEKLLTDNKINMVLLEGSESDGFWTQNSTEMEVIRDIQCPVWVIPKGCKHLQFKEILYATDYHEEDLKTLRKLIGLTHHLSPTITALHITDNMDFEGRIKKAGFHEMVKTKTAYDRVSVKSLVEERGDDVGQLINDYASLINANLIVVLKENRHFLERLVKSSSTKKIVQQASIPVLVYHGK
jgi:nucleotide-binding universal stress UspA family protein